MIVDTANLFKSFFRDSDIIARLGGDEFVILVQNSSDDNSEVIESRFQTSIDNFNKDNQRPYSLSISCGIALFEPDSHLKIADLIKQADELMYLQKHNKNQPPASK